MASGAGSYYQAGAGRSWTAPCMLLTADLVNLLGGSARRAIPPCPKKERTITSHPRHVRRSRSGGDPWAGTLEFVSGALVAGLQRLRRAGAPHLPIEIYGSKARSSPPIRTVSAARSNSRPGEDNGEAQDRVSLCRCRLPLDRTWPTWRTRSARTCPHRASGELALHVLEVMEALDAPAQAGRRSRSPRNRPERPAPFSRASCGASSRR